MSPSCSPVFPYKYSRFIILYALSVFFSINFTKSSIYDVCNKSSQFSVFFKFYQYLWSEFSKNADKSVCLEALVLILPFGLHVYALSLQPAHQYSALPVYNLPLKLKTLNLYLIITGTCLCIKGFQKNGTRYERWGYGFDELLSPHAKVNVTSYAMVHVDRQNPNLEIHCRRKREYQYRHIK